MSRARSHLRHLREIAAADLPKAYDRTTRPATNAELAQMDVTIWDQVPNDSPAGFESIKRPATMPEKIAMGIQITERTERDATPNELAQLGIHVIEDDDGSFVRRIRGQDIVWALVLAYANRETGAMEMADGSPPVPGTVMAGKVGMYGRARTEVLAKHIERNEPAVRAKLMDKKRPKELVTERIHPVTGEVTVVVPPVLTGRERLRERVPRIMGDDA